MDGRFMSRLTSENKRLVSYITTVNKVTISIRTYGISENTIEKIVTTQESEDRIQESE